MTVPNAHLLEAERVDRSAAVDEAAFSRLYSATAKPLRAYLLRSCGNLALADDLLQEAYLRLIRSGFEGNDDVHRRRYLFRIATNLLRDHFRRSRPDSHHVPELDEAPRHDDEIHLRNDVASAMSELSLRDRQMLWLAHVEGASHEEVADIMGIRPASVRSMLFRARKRLAAALHERGFTPLTEDS